MAKKTVVSEMASALGAVTARVENLKPKRTAAAKKHSKAKPMGISENGIAETSVKTAVNETPERDEIAIVAYLYSEARGFQGGSEADDWVRAEQEVRARRRA